jgi:hypothetical protein
MRIACLASLLFLLPLTIFAQDVPARFAVREGSSKYYFVPTLLPDSGRSQLSGFKVFNSSGHLVQFIPLCQDLSSKVPEYIRGGIPDALPVKFVDCNFDGYPDAMMRTNISPRYESFEFWTWDPKILQFRANNELNKAEINRVDTKAKYLISGGSGGGGNFGFLTYAFLSGKLVLVKREAISYRDNTDVTIFYKDSRETRRAETTPPPKE